MSVGVVDVRKGARPQSVLVRTLAWTILLALGEVAGAQVTTGADVGRAAATRSELERLAAQAESAAASTTDQPAVREQRRRDAAALRERLVEGDFRAGDRVVISVAGDSALSDTFTVRAGPALQLPDLPEIPMRGVLRSELRQHLGQHVGRFLKDTLVVATVLVPIGVLGEVANPGYYRLSIDLPISDAIMAAGGPTQRADMTRTTVRRGSREFLSREAVRSAMVGGLTLDDLKVAAGDEVLVAARRQRSWQTTLQAVSLVAGVVVSLFATGVF